MPPAPGRPIPRPASSKARRRTAPSCGEADRRPGSAASTWSGACLASEIVARGGVASFTSYPSGHDVLIWTRSLADHARDWLGPQERAALLAALPDPGCAGRPQWK
ncbi:hypothetical protein [uncultured Massilia sp.]|uniref:hypothetical protein n=1 Tax=uncultured Massilia sp. TaxID=169973 RepID=UPI00258B4767|nr:hypothetical protein [uncultured Massilia sp.]